MTVYPAVTVINIGPTKYCINTSLRTYAGVAGITSVVHDTLVFMAISWRLMTNMHGEHRFGTLVKGFVTGKYLPTFSKSLLQAGQLYYMCVFPRIVFD